MCREVSNFAWVLTGIPASAATFQRDTGFRSSFIRGSSLLVDERTILLASWARRPEEIAYRVDVLDVEDKPPGAVSRGHGDGVSPWS